MPFSEFKKISILLMIRVIIKPTIETQVCVKFLQAVPSPILFIDNSKSKYFYKLQSTNGRGIDNIANAILHADSYTQINSSNMV